MTGRVRTLSQLRPRFTDFSHEPKALAGQVAESFRDVSVFLAQQPLITIRSFDYQTSDLLTGRVSFLTNQTRPPIGVLLTRALKKSDPQATTFVESPTNWVWDSGTVSFDEPSSLDPGELYSLTFVVIGASND